MNADFDTIAGKFWRRFDKGLEIVLSSSAENDVTSRTVSAIALNGKVYFLTFEGSVKLAQIRQNTNVALCHFDLWMKGTANISGEAGKSENAAIWDALRKAYPEDMELFGQMPGTAIIEVSPVSGGFGRIKTGGMFILDFKARTASPVQPAQEA